MEKYQAFLISALLLILANYWYLFSDNSLLPRLFDYVAYGFFILGLYKLAKSK